MRLHNKITRTILLIVAMATFFLSAVGLLTINALKAKASQIEVGTLKTAHLSLEKNIFNVGEPILVTATEQNKGGEDWVGIGAKDNFTYTSIRWKYVSASYSSLAGAGLGDGATMDICLGSVTTGAGDLAKLPAGEYAVFFATGATASTASEVVYITIVDNAYSDAYLSISKTDFVEGEDIIFKHNVTSYGSKDWIGICGTDYTKGSIKWDYVNVAKGTNIVANDITQRAFTEYKNLQAGDYNIIYVQNDGAAYQAVSVIPITVHAKIDGTKQTSHLSLEKTVFKAGEPIYVTATHKNASGYDWIGIAQNYTVSSLRWKYVSHATSDTATSGAGSGVKTDIRTAKKTTGAGALGDIPAGFYQIIFCPSTDDNSTSKDATEFINIQVLSSKPSAPSSVALNLKNATDGLIDGTITVNFADYNNTDSYSKPTDIIMYWADENGNKLTEYSSLAKRKISSQSTTFNTYSGVKIPTNAKKLLVYAMNSGGELSDVYTITLPNGCQAKSGGNLIAEFQVVSDLHVTIDPNNDKTSHFAIMLKDIAENSPNSQGIMVAGDIVDTGSTVEYEYLVSKYNDLKGLYGDDLADMYFTIGNHELMCSIPENHGYNQTNDSVEGDDASQIARWMNYVKQVNPTILDQTDSKGNAVTYYSRTIGGIQHIYLGTAPIVDRTSGYAYINDEQLAWLDNLIKNNNSGKPIMVYLHQPFYNTVAGAIPPDNWDAIIAGDANMAYNSSAGKYQYRLNSREQNEKPLRDIFAKYANSKNIFMFTGHSHWYFDAEGNMVTEDNMPTMLNTSSVGYLWNDYYLSAGEYERGSQGYYVKVYEDRIEVLGRNFDTGTWSSSAQFVISQHTHDYQDDYNSEKHYKKCSCGDIIDEENHNIVNNNCTGCDYHRHDYTNSTMYNDDYHWGVCSCGEEDTKQGHTFTNGVCSCGYEQQTPPSGEDPTPPNDDEPIPPNDNGGGSNTPNSPTNSATTISCVASVGVREESLTLLCFIVLALISYLALKPLRKNKR